MATGDKRLFSYLRQGWRNGLKSDCARNPEG
jgi:hypothetical protein